MIQMAEPFGEKLGEVIEEYLIKHLESRYFVDFRTFLTSLSEYFGVKKYRCGVYLDNGKWKYQLSRYGKIVTVGSIVPAINSDDILREILQEHGIYNSGGFLNGINVAIATRPYNSKQKWNAYAMRAETGSIRYDGENYYGTIVLSEQFLDRVVKVFNNPTVRNIETLARMTLLTLYHEVTHLAQVGSLSPNLYQSRQRKFKKWEIGYDEVSEDEFDSILSEILLSLRLGLSYEEIIDDLKIHFNISEKRGGELIEIAITRMNPR